MAQQQQDSELIEKAKRYRRECTEIDRDDLVSEYMRVSADLAYWGAKKAGAYRRLSEAKIAVEEEEHEVKRVEGLLYMKYREELKEPDSKDRMKPPTEATINAHVIVDKQLAAAKDTYYKARLAQADAQHDFDQLYATCNAVEVKKEMLVSIGADRRAELNSDPNLRRMAREANDPLNRG